MELQFIDVHSDTLHTEEDCKKFLMNMRWSNGFCCPRCDHHEAFIVRTRRLLECKDCRMQVSLTAGTIMHKSKLSLLTWFRAIQLLIQDAQEYTASSLSHKLEINYRSAQLLLQKIHFAHLNKENRLNLFQKARKSSCDFQSLRNQEAFEGTQTERKQTKLKQTELKQAVLNQSDLNQSDLNQTDLNQTSSKEWDLQSYIESKSNRLNSKLMIRSILPTDYVRYVQSRDRSGFSSVCSVIFKDWIKTFVSVNLYPTFLKCFQLPA